MKKGSAMNLLELQQSSTAIARLLSKLENPNGFDPDAGGDVHKKPKEKRGDGNEETDGQDATQRLSIPSIRADGGSGRDQRQDDQHSDGSGSDEFVREASSEDDFLEYDGDELCGAFDSLNLVHTLENIQLLLDRVKTDQKFYKTEEIAAWFNSTASVCQQSEDELDAKEAACIQEFNQLELAHNDLRNTLESRDLNAVQCMRRFYNKVLSFRPEMDPAYLESKRNKAKKIGFRFPSFEETQEARRKREDDRRKRLQKELRSHTSLLDDETILEDEPKQAPEQSNETTEKKLEQKRTRTLSNDPSQENSASMIAQDLLTVISAQQDEIANLRSRADMNTKSTEAMRMALEFVRYERECEDAEQTGSKMKKKGAGLSDLGKEVLNDIVEQSRMKCITELLVTNEGRAFLETTEGAGKMLEAHSRGLNVMEEIEQLKEQMEVLQEQIGAVGDRSDRESSLRKAISDRKEEIARQEEEERKAAEAALAAQQQQQNATTLSVQKRKKGGRKTLTRTDTALTAFGEEPNNLGTILDDMFDSGDQSPNDSDITVGVPDLSWLFEQSRETQNQLDQITRGMEKSMSTINAVKSRLLRALDDVIDAAVDDELEKQKREEEGIVDFGTGNRDEQSVCQMKEKIKDQRKRLEEERAKTQQLEEQDLELKVSVRRLKKTQRDYEIEAKTKSREMGTSLARKATRALDDEQSDGTLASRGRRSSAKSSIATDAEKKKASPPTSAIPEEVQVLDENGEPLSNDMHEVRGQARVVGREIETLQKKEAQLQALAETALKRYRTTHRGSATSTATANAGTDATDSVKPQQEGLSRTESGTPSRSPHPGSPHLGKKSPAQNSDHRGDSRCSEHWDEDPSDEKANRMSPNRAKDPSSRGEGTQNSQMTATQAAAQFFPGHDSDSDHDELENAARHNVTHPKNPSKEGAQPELNKDKSAIMVALEPSQNTVVVDKREQQVKELLFYQSENDRLQKQISGVEKKIREAKLKSANPDQAATQAAPVFVKDSTLPEENRTMRREVRTRQRELNELRKKWQAESDKHKRGAYENNIPGQLEAALMLLLKAPPDDSEVQAKAEEEAKKREQEEAERRAQEEEERRAKEASQEEQPDIRGSISSLQSVGALQPAQNMEQRPSGLTPRRSSAFHTGAHKLSVSARELGSLFSAAAYKVQSPSVHSHPSSFSPSSLSPPESPGRRSQTSGLSAEAMSSSDLLRNSLSVAMRGSVASQGRLHRRSSMLKTSLTQEFPDGWNMLSVSSHTSQPEDDLAIMGQRSKMSIDTSSYPDKKSPSNRRNSSISSAMTFSQGRRNSSLLMIQTPRTPRAAADQFERVLKATAQPEENLNFTVVGHKETGSEHAVDLSQAAKMIAQKALPNKDGSQRTLIPSKGSLPPKAFLNSLASDLGLPQHDSPTSSAKRGTARPSQSIHAQHQGGLQSWGFAETHPVPGNFQEALPDTPRPAPGLAMGNAVQALKQRLSSQRLDGWQKMGNPVSSLPGIDESS